MSSVQSKLVRGFWIAVALLFAADIVLILKYTPDEQSMGADSEDLLSASAGRHQHVSRLPDRLRGQHRLSVAAQGVVG